jgi:hypothetical protein
MSLTFQDIWNLLNNAVSAINQFFNDLANIFTPITNTGQGIVAGLTSFGSFLWDGLNKFADAIKVLWTPLIPTLEDFNNFINNLGNLLYNAFTNIADAIFRFNEWIFNGLVWIGLQIVNVFEDIINYFMSLLTSVWNQLNTWFSEISTITNAWFTDFALRFRRKIQLLLVTEPAYYAFEHSFKKFVDEPSLKGLARIVVTPILGAIGGSLMATFLDSLTPNPFTTPLTILPALRLPTMPDNHLDITKQIPTYPSGASRLELEFMLSQSLSRESNISNIELNFNLNQGIGMV